MTLVERQLLHSSLTCMLKLESSPAEEGAADVFLVDVSFSGESSQMVPTGLLSHALDGLTVVLQSL